MSGCLGGGEWTAMWKTSDTKGSGRLRHYSNFIWFLVRTMLGRSGRAPLASCTLLEPKRAAGWHLPTEPGPFFFFFFFFLEATTTSGGATQETRRTARGKKQRFARLVGEEGGAASDETERQGITLHGPRDKFLDATHPLTCPWADRKSVV